MTDEARHADDYKGSGGGAEGNDHEWSEQEREHLFPIGWPYRDLPLKLPNCPLCGWAMVCVAAERLHPMAWCHNDQCRVLTWDPSLSAQETLRGVESHGFYDVNDDAEGDLE